MPNLKDAQELTAPIEQIADQIAEQADGLAETFGSMNETLMERIKTVSSSSSRKATARS